jgi:hypothetical protein
MKQWLIDTGERALFTFLETFLALVLANGQDWLDVTVLRSAAIGGVAAVLAVLKAAIASRKTEAVSPASLAPDTSVN